MPYNRIADLYLTVNLSKKLAFPSIVLVLITACAGAPVQEMSDARQAIHSAEEAGAERYSPQQLREARNLLEKAQTNLEVGAYFDAKQLALEARAKAIQARQNTNTGELDR